MNIGIDLSTIYVTACGQVMPSYASGRQHEAECQACQCAIAGESEPDENDDEPDEPDENETPDDDAITCAFCDAWVPNVETAIENDWIPSYWDGEVDCCDDPVCPACQAAKLRTDEDGESVLILDGESKSADIDKPQDQA